MDGRKLLLILAAALAGAGCVPKPGEPVDYLAIEEAVLIQRKAIEDRASELEQRSATPDFTLYGDGTLIVARDNGEADVLVVTELANDQIESLLDYIVDRGFMDIAYDQTAGEPGPTTYLYVQTQTLANSVAASTAALAGDDPSDEATALARVIERMDADAAAALEGGSEIYVPIAGTLTWQVFEDADAAAATDWPLEIDLAEAQERLPGVDVFSIGVQLPQAAGLDPANSAGICWRNVRQGDVVFDACLRPALPYEENFPEFELPTRS